MSEITNSIGNDPDRLYSELTYQEKLNFTQNIKQEVLHKLMTSGMNDDMPTDKESIDSMMKVMDSMDRTTLTDRKNDNDAEVGKSAKELLAAMSMFVKEAQNTNPFSADVEVREAPEVDDAELGEFEYNPGEAEVGVCVEEYSEFDKRMDSIRQEQLAKEADELGL